jgi:hypothetical protein
MPIDSAMWRKDLTNTDTVGIPPASISLATCPTDTWHTGQTGTSNSTSIWSRWRRAAQSRAIFFTRPCAAAPVKE